MAQGQVSGRKNVRCCVIYSCGEQFDLDSPESVAKFGTQESESRRNTFNDHLWCGNVCLFTAIAILVVNW